jgi:hypothetical protein
MMRVCSTNFWQVVAPALLLSSAVTPVTTTIVVLDTVGTSIGTVSPHFVGVNMDWWLPKCGGEGKVRLTQSLSTSLTLLEFCIQLHDKAALRSYALIVHTPPQDWGNASAAVVDLQNPNLLTLAKGLSGASLRIGGTHGDSIAYMVGNSAAAVKCGGSPWTPARCYPICLPMHRFTDLVTFADAANLALVFGLNMKQPDPGNLLALLNYSHAHNLSVNAFELGNELGNGKTAGAAIFDQGPAIRAFVNQAWPDPNSRPLLIGPDDAVRLSALDSVVLGLAPPLMTQCGFRPWILSC